MLHSFTSSYNIVYVSLWFVFSDSCFCVSELRVRAHRGTVYMTSNGECYYRVDNNTDKITKQVNLYLYVFW